MRMCCLYEGCTQTATYNMSWPVLETSTLVYALFVPKVTKTMEIRIDLTRRSVTLSLSVLACDVRTGRCTQPQGACKSRHVVRLLNDGKHRILKIICNQYYFVLPEESSRIRMAREYVVGCVVDTQCCGLWRGRPLNKVANY